jgi:hypothetical protein
MKRSVLAGTLLAVLGLAAPALGQGGGGIPPTIEDAQFAIARFIGPRELANLADFGSIFALFGVQPLWADPVPFDPNVDLAQELDVIVVTMLVFDPDLADPQNANNVGFFYEVFAFPQSLGPPEPPPLYTEFSIIGLTLKFITLGAGIPADPGLFGPNRVFLSFAVQIPRFQGVNQDRLRGLIDYDVAYNVQVRVADTESPDENTHAWGTLIFPLRAVEATNLAAPNPPPVADAGGDQTVQVGTAVKLDGSKSFDASNAGFDPFDPNVFQKDILHYTWEWVDGPEQVDPQPDPDAPPGLAAGTWPIAVVTLEVANTADKPFYIYRLLVDDGINSPPSSAETRILVIPAVRENRAPSAVISDANGAVVSGQVVSVRVGDPIQLSAQLSTDPDDDALAYHWRQTNALGGALAPDEVQRGFQPLNGVEARDLSWVATEVGTFYFSLLVNDVPPAGLDSLSATASVTIDVAEGATAGEVTGRASGAAGAPATDGQSGASGTTAAPTACGGGSVLPLALIPAGLWLMRGRRR